MLKLLLSLSACLCLAGSQVRAQDQDSSAPPKPPAKVYGPIGVDDQQDQEQQQTPDQLQPDNRPLTGFLEPTIGSPPERHSYWVPGVSYNNFVQNNGQVQGGGTSWNSTNYLAGSVTLLENWSRAQLLVNYTGGGEFSTDPAIGNGWFSQLNLYQTFRWERLQLTFLDEFVYLPQALFGFGAGTNLGLPGVGGSLAGVTSGLAPGYTPGQTIFSAVGPRNMNTAGVQVNYQLTRRSSITLGGIFSVLRFSDPGNIDSNDYIGTAGYNYEISRKDSIGVVYRYSAYHYLDNPQAVGDQMFHVAYGRKITGRLALELTAGPEITNFRIPLAGTTKTQYIAGSGSASLTYAFARGSVSAGYFHGVTGGSGVFYGALTDNLTASATRKLTRVWTASLHVGYAHNRNEETSSTVGSTDYNTIFAGGSLTRPLGRNANLFVGYTAFVENANSTICAGANCGSSFTTNQISVGLSWHARPFVLR
jgi:hypothetical protein